MNSDNMNTHLNDNDVILGSGTPFVEFIGNRRFRRLVAERKERYTRAPKRGNGKVAIAKEIFDQIQSLGGRFLKLEKEVWCEVEESQALEKCKKLLGTTRPASSNGTYGKSRNVAALNLPSIVRLLPKRSPEEATKVAEELRSAYLEKMRKDKSDLHDKRKKEGTFEVIRVAQNKRRRDKLVELKKDEGAYLVHKQTEKKRYKEHTEKKVERRFGHKLAEWAVENGVTQTVKNSPPLENAGSLTKTTSQ